MRNQTPIQQQRTTQTQLSRGRPHNPSITRRIQSPGQRKSPLRQMQQQTRQRTRRKRQSTPLPEKRGRKKQTTHRRHANTTHQHMVNHTPPFHNNRKGAARRKTGNRENREENTTRETQWCSGITCVLAKLRAHYPEHQQQRGRERQREEKRRRDHTLTHPAIPQSTTQCDRTRHALPSHTVITTRTEMRAHHTPSLPSQTITAIPQ